MGRDICKTNRTANVSGYSALFCNFFQQEWPWDWAGRFAYNKPSKFNKMGDNFFMDFSFFAHRFFKENLWFFSHMPLRLVQWFIIKTKINYKTFIPFHMHCTKIFLKHLAVLLHRFYIIWWSLHCAFKTEGQSLCVISVVPP